MEEAKEMMKLVLRGDYESGGGRIDALPVSCDAPDGELGSQLLLISDKIRLIERQLAELGEKKERLVRQVKMVEALLIAWVVLGNL